LPRKKSKNSGGGYLASKVKYFKIISAIEMQNNGGKKILVMSRKIVNKKYVLPAVITFMLFFVVSNLNEIFPIQFTNYTSDTSQIA